MDDKSIVARAAERLKRTFHQVSEGERWYGKEQKRRAATKVRKLNFVERMTRPGAPVIQNPDGTVSTHKMAWGQDKQGYYAFPTIIERNGGLKELPPKDADRYAHRTGELKRFRTRGEAEKYAAGSWKKPR